MLQVCPDITPLNICAWVPCSRWLASVSLFACAEGESVPPAYQTISPTEKEEKEKLVRS